VRRDDVEHLVMIGGNQDLVIESNIESGLAGSSSFSTRAPAEEPVSMRTPKPAVFGSRRPILRSVEPSMTNDGREEDDAR
jgi:flagellar protein FliO/FliZ